MSTERTKFEPTHAPHFSIDGHVLKPTDEPGINPFLVDEPPFNFDLAQNLLVHPHKVAAVPDSPRHLVRWLSDDYIWPYNDEPERDVQQIIQTSCTHFEALQSFGINIPKHQHIAIGKHLSHKNGLALYTAVERLNVISWPYTNTLAFQAEHVYRPLLRYADWVEATKQPFMLTDIGSAEQFGLVRSQNGTTSVYLLDIEAMLCRATPKNLKQIFSMSKLIVNNYKTKYEQNMPVNNEH